MRRSPTVSGAKMGGCGGSRRLRWPRIYLCAASTSVADKPSAGGPSKGSLRPPTTMITWLACVGVIASRRSSGGSGLRFAGPSRAAGRAGCCVRDGRGFGCGLVRNRKAASCRATRRQAASDPGRPWEPCRRLRRVGPLPDLPSGATQNLARQLPPNNDPDGWPGIRSG